MSTRKEKADKKRASRQEKKVITPEAAKVVGVNTPDLSAPAHMDVRRYNDRGNVEAITPVVPAVPNAAPKSIVGKDTLSAVQGNAEVQNPVGITNPATEAAKEATRPKTLSDYLAEQRANLVKDKTDAVKMQKYYALTDALGALGKMGGAAVGGAIGGNMLDSAPAVGEYQPSRGYIDAFEKAQQANERLRALDDKQFQLAYSKQQRDEERAYAEKKTREDRAYQAEQNRINREFQAEQARLTREWNKAVADGNREAQAKIERDLAVLRHQNDMALQRLKNQGALDEKTAGQAYSKWQADMYNTTPIRFSDGTTIKIPDNYYEAIRRSLINNKVNDKAITKDNVDSFIVNNPALINQYLADWGFVPNKQEEQAPVTQTPTVQKTPYSGPSSRIDYANEQGPSSHNEIKEGSDEASMEEKKNKWRNRNSN